MSRTYRRIKKGSKNKWNHSGKKTRVGSVDTLSDGLPPCYKNARRQRCSASGQMKWWFHSKGAAVEAARYNYLTRMKRGKGRKYERAYHCWACDGWHLTTKDLQEWHDRKAQIAELNDIELDENGNFTERKPTDCFPDRPEGLA